MAEEKSVYELPKLDFEPEDLAPYLSEEQVRIHHAKHHQAYVNGANAILKKLDVTRKEGNELDLKATCKELSFNIGGHLLHSLFFENLAPAGKGGASPVGLLDQVLKKEFGTIDRFRKEFSQTANSVEGSGWAALTYCRETQRPLIMQVEKHNNHVYPMFRILMVLDVFEHAYYLDYKNDRAKYVEAFWNIVNWGAVTKRFEELLK